MNVYLLYKDSESVPKDVSMNRNEIVQDLNLDIIFKTMSRGDKFIYKTVRAVMTNPLTDMRTVLYRQGILTDCVKRFDEFNKVYEMTAQTIEIVERFTEGAKKSNSSNLSNAANVIYSLELLGILVDCLEKLKLFIDTFEMNFDSYGMKNFYDRLINDYNYEFVQKIKNSIEEMNFLTEGGEITFSATVGQGLKAKDMYVNSLVKDEFTKRRAKAMVAQLFNRLFKRNVIMLDTSELDKDARDLEAAGLAHIMKLYQSFIKELTSFF
jgi:hypothetical protein